MKNYRGSYFSPCDVNFCWRLVRYLPCGFNKESTGFATILTIFEIGYDPQNQDFWFDVFRTFNDASSFEVCKQDAAVLVSKKRSGAGTKCCRHQTHFFSSLENEVKEPKKF